MAVLEEGNEKKEMFVVLDSQEIFQSLLDKPKLYMIFSTIAIIRISMSKQIYAKIISSRLFASIVLNKQ